MALGADNDYVFWTVLDKLSPAITEFPAGPYEIMIGSDGNQLSHTDWNGLSTVDEKIKAIYRTAAVNKARKAFQLSSLQDLRFTKNTVNINITVDEDINISGYTNKDGGPPNGTDVYVYQGKAHQKIALTAGKKYVITFPDAHPLRFSTVSDGRGKDDLDNDAVEFTKDITISGNTLTIDVKGFTSLRSLHYYCSSHAGMGGEIEILAPYTLLEPQLAEDGLPVQEEEELEYFPVYDNDDFTDLTKDDIVIDLDTLPDTIGSLSKQDIIDGLAYIPTENSNVFNDNLSEFINRVNAGNMFIDAEDAIDGFGNKMEYSPSESEYRDDPDDTLHLIQQSDGIGPSAIPNDISESDFINVQTKASEFWWQRVLAGVNWLRTLVNCSTYEKNGTIFFDPKDLKYFSELHATKELTQKLEPEDPSEKFDPQHNFHFDDLHSILNIKDPAFGVSLSGDGGQDLSKLQKIRKCKVINDAGIVSEMEDAIFSIHDVPAGSLYLGSDTIVMPPNSFAEPIYDDCTRLVLGFYGSDVQDLSKNNNLAYRILHDFNRKWFSDTSDLSIRYPDEYYLQGAQALTINNVKNLNNSLTWTNGSSWGSEVPGNLFKLRRRQGGGSGIAFLVNGAAPISDQPAYRETTVSASDFGLEGDISFTYRVLAPNWTLNTRLFAMERSNTWYTLDEYGFDINPAPANGPSARNQSYFWTPLPSA
jgi:hypothetical protein